MRRFVAVSFVLAAATTLLARSSGAADLAPIHLETLVPGKSLAFASLENVGTIGKRMKATALGRMLDDPEMKGFLAPLSEDLNKLVHDKQSKGGLPIPPMAMDLIGKLTGLEGQAAVALVDMDERRPVIAGCLDFGAKLSDFVEFIGRIKDDPSGDKAPISAREDAGRTYWLLGNPEHPGMFATAVGTAILCSTDHDWLVKTATGGLTAVDGALAASAPFQRVRAASGGDALALSLYANVPSILSKVKMGERGAKMADALGLGQIEAAGYGLAFTGDGILDSIVVDAPTADHGILAMMPTKATDHASLAWAPSTAFYYGEENLDLAGVVTKVKDLVRRLDPEMAEPIDKTFGRVRDVIGMDLEKDVLAGFGEGLAFWLSMPETGGLYPELGLSFEVKDPAAFEKTIASVADKVCEEAGKGERMAASRRVIEWHGKRLHVIDLVGVGRHAMVPFTPTICFVGNRMLVTLVPHAMKEILLRQESGTANAGLGGQEDVQALIAAGPKGHASFAYLDLQAILNLAYDTAVPALQTVAKPNVLGNLPVRLDWAQLPATRSMRPYFRSLGAFCVSDGKSLRISIHSPIGIVGPIAAMAAAYAVMGGRRSAMPIDVPDKMANDAASEASIRALADAEALRDAVLAFYQAKNKLPEGLADLTVNNPKTGSPYLGKVPLDPWGFGFVYTVTDAATATFEVRAWGADGLPRTDDDVVAVGAGK
jgi:hypothetical protein